MRWQKGLRRLGWIGLAVVVLVAAVATWHWFRWSGSGKPLRSGSVTLAGLQGPVTVRWDRWGVPMVEASSGRDLAFALGWIHANDRLTQMELGRRAAAGRLAEIAGPAAVDLDREARQLRLRWAAEVQWKNAGDESREWLEAYAAGVNTWIDARTAGDDLPPGLRLLGLAPEPWQPVDSLSFAMLMARDLSFWDGRPEEARLRWLEAFGEERTWGLIGEGGEGASLGSNNWILGPSWTASGSSLVANDPHLPLRLPSVWYQVLLRSPDYEVAGMTLPGLPGVVIGRSRHLSWALTNTMLDDHDLFLEELDETGTRVRRGDAWVEIQVEETEIPVRGADPVALTLRTTDHGPLLPADSAQGLPARSLAWTAYYPADPLGAFLGLARATNLEEARAAAARYAVPSQNLVVTEAAGGAMTYVMLGRSPQRRRGDGRLAAPGWDPTYGWEGLAPAEENLVIADPADDLLVTANHDVRPPDWQDRQGTLIADFDTDHRARRIRQLLTARHGWQPAELASVQTDILSLYAQEVLAAARGEYSGDAGRAYALLTGWDGTMAADESPQTSAAALFTLFEHHLRQRAFGDEAEQNALPPFDSRARILDLMEGRLTEEWFDDVSTPAVEDRTTIVAAALEAAWREAGERWGEDPDRWRYGALHPLTLRHPLGAVPVLGRFFSRGPWPTAGSASTVAAFGGRWQGDTQAVVYGPSMRWITDAADGDRTLAVLPGGQSGHPFDPHYDDQLPLYQRGEVRAVAWTPAAVEAATREILTLQPEEGPGKTP